MTNSQELLREAQFMLPAGEYDTPRLDAMILLAKAWDLSREQLYARLQDPVPSDVAARFQALVDRRAGGEPIAYILENKEFYGLDFYVDRRVLIPRPDTEILVDWVLESHSLDGLKVHDCCTGSGAIALTIANQRRDWVVDASDISIEAGEVFSINRRSIEGCGQVGWKQQDLLSGMEPASRDIITSNPPYLTSAETGDKRAEGWIEPMLALDGGADGLILIRKLVDQATRVLVPGGWLYIEAADGQAESIADILKNADFIDVEVKKDLAELRRISRGKYNGTDNRGV